MSNASLPDPHAGDGRPVNTGILVPVAPAQAELAYAARVDHTSPIKTAPLDQKAVLASVRRRWFPALSLGLVAGICAAGITWLVVPLTYTAYSELYIASNRATLGVFKPHESERFEVYRQTQTKMIKSPFVLNAAVRDEELAKLSILMDEPHPIDWLEQHITISNPGTEFLRISLTGQEPKELAQIVKGVTNAYLAEVVNHDKIQRTNRARDLERAHTDLDEELKKKMRHFRRLATDLQTGSPQALAERQKGMMEITTMLRSQRAKLFYELIEGRNKQQAAEAAANPNAELAAPAAMIEMQLADDPAVQHAEEDLHKKRAYLDKLEAATAKDKPNAGLLKIRREVETAEKSLEDIKGKRRPLVVEHWRTEMKNKTETALAHLGESVKFTKAMLDEIDAELAKNQIEVNNVSSWAVDIEQVRDEIDQVKKIDQKITEEITRLRVEDGAEGGERVKPYRPAETPHRPDYEKKFRMVGLAGFAGLGLVFGAIVWFDLRARRISSLDEVASGLRLPILGSLPAVPRRLGGGKSRGGIAKADVWQGSLMESIDSARVMLLRRAELENAKVAMVVSAMMSEGKTTLSCHLATSLARAGHRTLLVDSDIRRPTVHRVFDAPCEPGLCELLRKESQLEQVVFPTMQEGLFVLPAGRLSPEALRELAQDALNPIMARLREEYDFVIIDSSPILPVTDSLLVSQYVDGAIFSIRRDVSQYPKVATACQRLAMIGIPLWGAVVIGLDQVSYGYRYAYAYGYGATRSAAG
jgi:capsular exopolysaccharide synthesis family protein